MEAKWQQLEQQLTEQLDALQQEAEQMLGDMVRCDSVLGNEGTIQQYMKTAFEKLRGFEVSPLPLEAVVFVLPLEASNSSSAHLNLLC